MGSCVLDGFLKAFPGVIYGNYCRISGSREDSSESL